MWSLLIRATARRADSRPTRWSSLATNPSLPLGAIPICWQPGSCEAVYLPSFLAAADADPQVLVCGRPVFDASIPRHRFYFRYLTHAMVWLNTLSFDIPDSMCGLRVYPLPVVLPILAAEPPGRRMDFDSDVLVRLYWRGVRMQWLPIRVRYPLDGVSHFRLVRDNWLITRMHTRLFFGMLRRSPRLLARKLGVAT